MTRHSGEELLNDSSVDVLYPKIYFSNLTVTMAPSCVKLQNLPIRWGPMDTLHVSVEPKYVRWTDFTIMEIFTTTPWIMSSSSVQSSKQSDAINCIFLNGTDSIILHISY